MGRGPEIGPCRLAVSTRTFPLKGAFTISRGSKTDAVVVVAELRAEDGTIGRGECTPYARYGESVPGVLAAIEELAGPLAEGLDGISAMAPGAARNALDCARWDLKAKRAGRPVWNLAGLPKPGPVTTAQTLSADTPEAMAAAARAAMPAPLLKLKLTGAGDLERVAAVHLAVPEARLIVDANEGWRPDQVGDLLPRLAELGVDVVEQPVPAGADAGLENLPKAARPVALCADESCHDRAGLPALAARYDMINIKLDKTGGLTEALALRQAARALGLAIMVGCMMSSSLSMAPALLVAQGAEVVDLDGPLWLAEDWRPPIRYRHGRAYPADPALWG